MTFFHYFILLLVFIKAFIHVLIHMFEEHTHNFYSEVLVLCFCQITVIMAYCKRVANFWSRLFMFVFLLWDLGIWNCEV